MTAEQVEEVKKLAEAHWEFLERWLHMIYVDAMIHGVKHGAELALEKMEPFRKDKP
jgi:hypothetical protein